MPYIAVMKHRGNILLAMILALLAISADGHALANAMAKRQETQLRPSAGHVEFVMVRTSQLPDLASETKTTSDAHPTRTVTPIPRIAAIRAAMPSTNQSFGARRHETYIPLRL